MTARHPTAESAGSTDPARTADLPRTAGPSSGESGPAVEWRALNPRTLAVHCSWMAAPLASLGFTALATGGHLELAAWIRLAYITLAFAVITLIGLGRWWRTRYRVTDDSFELRTGLFTRRLRAIPLHRVRNVDLTANPVQRIFGLTVLRAGTIASTDGGRELKLEALTRPAAERLRTELLARAGTTGTEADEPVLSVGDPRWLRYAPLTFWVFGGVFAAAGTLWRVLDQAGVEPWKIGFVRHAFEEFGNSALWLTIPIVLLAIIVLGSVGSVVLSIENWWKFRLEWADTGTLRVRRGLFTTRSVSIERARLRGAVLREPLLLRFGGGATVRAIAGGLGNRDQAAKRSTVLPPAPRAEALRVCAGLLASVGTGAGTADPAGQPERRGPRTEAANPVERPVLNPHPPVAFRRRMMRCLVWVVLPGSLALLVLGLLFSPVLLYCAVAYALVTVVAGRALARDAYRNLGHGVAGKWLLIGSGTFSRDTVALDRSGVLAWTFTDNPWSRRAGVVTVVAAVAADVDGWRIRDIAADEAVGFADTAVPGILDEFLVGHPGHEG